MDDEPEEQEDEEDSAEGAAKAFDEAVRGFTLFDRDLAPYSPSRVLAAQNMGMRFPVLGDEAQNTMSETGLYPGAMEDTAILTWLCSIPDYADPKKKGFQWTPERAADRHSTAKVAAIGWASKEGILDIKGQKFAEAYRVMLAIVSGMEASKFRLQFEDEAREAASEGKT